MVDAIKIPAPQPHDAMQATAFEIADKAMWEVLVTECHSLDDLDTVLALCNADGQLVSTLELVSDDLKVAVHWLEARGYVRLARDSSGEFVQVDRRPADEG